MRGDDASAAGGAEPRVAGAASARGAAPRGEDVVRVGVISDTHGQLSDEVPGLFAGVDRIVHAGDVGDERVLQRLALVAPVTAVHGNMDAGLPAADLPLEAVLDVGRVRLLVGHVKEALLRRHDPSGEGIAVVVTGHTHRAQVANEGGVLYLNPGTANRTRGFGRPASVALLDIDGRGIRAEIVTLKRS